MTKKDYVLEVTQQLQANPKAVLTGHGISPTLLKAIASRPDVLSKLANFGFMTKRFNTGAKSLKKTNVLKISAYKNFADFNKRARIDVETFIGKLKPEQADVFENNENIITILVLPDTASGETENDIVAGKSTVLKFETSIKKEYKINGGWYLTIMFTEDSFKQKELTIANAKAKVNERKVARKQKTPALVKRELALKAKKRKEKITELTAKAKINQAEMQQLNRVAVEYGADISDAGSVRKAMAQYTQQVKNFLQSLTTPEKEVYKNAMKAKAQGNNEEVTRLLKTVRNPLLNKIVRGGGVKDSEMRVADRKKVLTDQINMSSMTTEKLLNQLEIETDESIKTQLRRKIKANLAKAEMLKAKVGVYKDLGATAINKKAELLAKTNAKIGELIGKGNSVQQAVNVAVAELPVTPQVKQQIKQQIVDGVAQQLPTQYAVQQALQKVVTSDAIQTMEVEEFVPQVAMQQQRSYVGEASVMQALNWL